VNHFSIFAVDDLSPGASGAFSVPAAFSSCICARRFPSACDAPAASLGTRPKTVGLIAAICMASCR